MSDAAAGAALGALLTDDVNIDEVEAMAVVVGRKPAVAVDLVVAI